MDYNLVLKKYFGYDKLKYEQERVVKSVIAGKDTIGLLPTGFGKSITFQLPALLFPGITIVISPLIALMQDQVINLKKKNIPSEYINSLQSYNEQTLIYEKLKRGLIKILYVSAERLLTTRFQEIIKKVDVSLFVCDEAHTLLWSEDFRDALGRIDEFISMLPKRPRMLALTATAVDTTIEKICSILKLKEPNIITINCDRDNIFYRVIKTNNKDRDLYFFLRNKKNIHIVIYCLTIRNVNHVYEFLKTKNMNVNRYYGSLESNIKKEILEDFKNNLIDIIVCTNAFGMGVDVPDIRYVLLYDMPQSIEDFLQQTGRASRDNKYGEGILFFNKNDISTIEYFIENIEDKKDIRVIKNERYKKLDSMVNFALTSKCLHGEILDYFGIKNKKKKCNMCSNCKKEYDV